MRNFFAEGAKVKKKYRKCNIYKYSDGSVALISPHRHKGSSRNRDGRYYTSVTTGGIRKAKKKIDNWKKP